MIRPSGPQETIPGFRDVPRTGVIYVMHRAGERGFMRDRDTWANLGQGAPECGELDGAPPRITSLQLPTDQNEYAPVGGTLELRERVANFYNNVHRDGRSSLYTPDNVSIASGGRASMTRIAAALGSINMGHFIPDYTAYEELLTTFKGFVPIPIIPTEDGQGVTPHALEREIVGRGLGALLLSNPCNPTGQVIEGEKLNAWVALARDNACTLIVDEFYSHYIYTGGDPSDAKMVSAAAHIDDVERDPVIVVDGLTKNWRYPGWRISWILAPSEVIERVNSAGSFLDGGASHPFQSAAVGLLDIDVARRETTAIQKSFLEKRRFMVDGLRSLGVTIDHEPSGAFYVWGNVGKLPTPLNDGFRLFEAGLDERVITVPGVFFDVNPGGRRSHSQFESFTRFSFGPSMTELERGLASLERVIRNA